MGAAAPAEPPAPAAAFVAAPESAVAEARVPQSGKKTAVPARLRPPVESSRTVVPPASPETAQGDNPPDESPILSESRSFSGALTRWHRDHDAAAALAALGAHERQFPGGRFALEAALLRAEILLHEGREREGLQLLNSVPLAGVPRARELLTVRGELRVKFGRCEEGRRDLDVVLAKDTTDGFAERANRAIRLCP